MLDHALLSKLEEHFTKITAPVELVTFLDGSERSAQVRAFVAEIAGASSRITVVDGDVRAGSASEGKSAASAGQPNTTPRRPSFRVRRAGNPDVAVDFAGLPLGHELTSLVLAVLQVGGHPSTAPAGVVAQIGALDRDLHFETYFSTSCQNCPDVVQALNLMSVVNPRIAHVAIDGAAFPDEVEARQVRAVPTVYCNGELFGQGRMTLEEIVGRLDGDAAERTAAAIDAKERFDVLVVGGGPAGVAAAVYAARKGIRTGLVAERFGGQVLDTMAIENFISVPYTEGPELGAALERHLRAHDVDVMELQRATGLVPAGEPGGAVSVTLESGASVWASTVVLAPGARWRHLGVAGEQEYRNKGVTYCPHCDGPLFKGKRVAVVGGGNSGVEAAIDLAGVAAHVTLLEFDGALRADEVLQRKLRSLPNADVVLGAQTTEVLGDGATVTGLAYVARATGDAVELAVDGVFVQIGLLPNTEWLREAVELDEGGQVVIDEHGRTSLPGVFAAGDCTTVPFKQIVVAMGGGSTAALSAFEHLIRASAPIDPAEASAESDPAESRVPAQAGALL